MFLDVILQNVLVNGFVTKYNIIGLLSSVAQVVKIHGLPNVINAWCIIQFSTNCRWPGKEEGIQTQVWIFKNRSSVNFIIVWESYFQCRHEMFCLEFLIYPLKFHSKHCMNVYFISLKYKSSFVEELVSSLSLQRFVLLCRPDPFIIRPFEKRTYYAVAMSVRPSVHLSVRLSVRPSGFSGLFFNMLWDINLKLGIYIQ